MNRGDSTLQECGRHSCSACPCLQVRELDDMMETSMARQGVRPPPNGSLPQWDGWLDDDPEAAAADIAALLRAARVNATVDPNRQDSVAARGMSPLLPCLPGFTLLH